MTIALKQITFTVVGAAAHLAGAAASAASATGALTTGGGGGGLTSLGTLANTATPGAYTQWTGGFLSGAIDNPAADDPVISNGSRCDWDPVRKKNQYYGHGHGNDYQSLTLEYLDASNGWINTASTPIGSGSGFPTHQFTGQAGNSVTGDLYFIYQDSELFKRVGGTSTWLDLGEAPQGAHGQGCGIAFLPGWSTHGGVVCASCYGIDVYDEATGTWTELSNGTGLHLGDSGQLRQCIGFFDVAASAVFFISVAGANSQTIYKVSANGTITQKGNSPVVVNVNISPSTPSGVVCDGYTSLCALSNRNTNGVVRKPRIMMPGGAQYEYTSGTDTWATVFAGTGPTAPASNFGIFGGICSTYDLAFFYGQSSSDGSATGYVYLPI